MLFANKVPTKSIYAAEAVVSTVIAVAILPTVDTLPATSVCFTWIALAAYVPAAKVKLVALPVVHVLPASVLYCHVAPLSRPDTVTVPTFLGATALEDAAHKTKPQGEPITLMGVTESGEFEKVDPKSTPAPKEKQ